MRSGIRRPLLAVLCLGLSQLQAAGQKTEATSYTEQGQIVVHQEAAPKSDDANNAAQGMQTPVLGFVISAEQGELRLLLGIPGASALGEPLAVPAGLRDLFFAPNQSYALLAPKAGGFLGLMAFQGAEEGAVVSICGAIPRPDIVAFSPGASAAALYSRAEGRLQVITGLPDSPQLARVVSGSDLPEEVRYLAVADDGVTLLEGTVHDAVYVLPQLGLPRLLYTAGDLQGMAFAPRTDDLVAFDRAAGTAFLLQDVDGASAYVLLADGLSGLDGNVFLQTSRAGAVIASTKSSTLWEINLQSFKVQNIPLPGMPQMLQPLRISGDFLLFFRTGLPGWILDSNSAEGSISFVPAGAAPSKRPGPFPFSTIHVLKDDQSEQPDLISQGASGAACTGAPEPTPAPQPLPRPRY
jgi:hypothetical protein